MESRDECAIGTGRQVEFRQEFLLRISLARDAGVKLESLLPLPPSR